MTARSVPAAALDGETRARLLAAPPAAGRVHSVFARAANLLWHDGRLVALHGPGMLRAPFAVALAAWPPGGDLRPGAPVERHGARLLLAGVALDLGAARAVDLRLGAAPHPPGALLRALRGVAPPPAAPGLSSSAARAAQEALRDGIRFREPEALRRGARGLVGLGEGLTPAGDDCLVGALAALQAFAPPLARELAAALPEVAGGTTLVAREFLLSAAEGRFAEALVGLCSGPLAEAPGMAVRLFAAGATSGADTFRGIRLALEGLAAPAAPAAAARGPGLRA